MHPRILLLASVFVAASSGPAIAQTPAENPGFFGSPSKGINPSATASEKASVAIQSPFERELTQLQEQRESDLAASAAAVNRRYLPALEALLSRARRANDTQAADKINTEFQRLRFTVQAALEPENMTADGFTAALVGTKWTWFGTETLTFLADGKAMWSGDEQPWPWKVANTKNFIIESRNLKRGRKFTITFERDLQSGTIEGDEAKRKTELLK